MGKHGQGEPHGREVVDGHNAFNVFSSHLIGALALGNASVIDEDIDATIESSNEVGSKRIDSVEVREVGNNHCRTWRCCLAALKHIGQTVGTTSNDRDSGAPIGSLDRKRFANSRRCSGDDDVLAGEIAHLLVPVTLFEGIADAVTPADLAGAGESSALGVVGD